MATDTKKSLAAQAGLVGEFKLPAMFEQAPTVKPRALCPYVAFVHPMSPSWGSLSTKCPGLQESDPVLVGPGDAARKLAPFKYHLLTAKQYWTKGDSQGNVTDWSLTSKADFGENVEAVILVMVDDKLVPATCQFRTTKSGGVHPMVQALETSAGEDWAKLSPQHKETLVCQKPFMRFYGEVVVGPKRTSKGTGRAYTPATVKVYPTTVAEWRVLSESFKSELFQKELEEAAEAFTRRMDDIQSKAK